MKWIVTHVDELENFACEFGTASSTPTDEEILEAIREAGLTLGDTVMVAQDIDNDDLFVVYDEDTDEDLYYVEPDEDYE